MNKLELYFTSSVVAGIFMAMLATRFGLQSTLETLSNSYRVTTEPVDKKATDQINFYKMGLIDAFHAVKSL